MEKRMEVDYVKAVSQFDKAIKKFEVKRIIYRSLFKAKGLEFDSYRTFDADDDASRIDWKASLRSNDLLVRSYVEESDLNVYFVVDVSSKMLFGSGKKLKAEYAAEALIALSHLVLDSDDNPGVIMFSDQAIKILMPSRSRNQLRIMAKFLSDPELYGGDFNFKNAIEYVLRTVKSKFSVIIFLSDFIHLKSDFERELKLLTAKFETIAFMIRDPIDDRMPRTSQQFVLEDISSGKQIVVNPSMIAEDYMVNALRQKNAVKKLLRESGVDILELHTDNEFVIPVVSFLKSRVGRV